MGMGHRAGHYPSQLSGGQQQRVAIARALVTEPDIILADEPTGNLDSRSGEAVMELLQELNTQHGTTILMVTHDMHYARQARRIVQISDGQVVDDDFGDVIVSLHPEFPNEDGRIGHV
jgi:putative ABC transport system ATP-binding protein